MKKKATQWRRLYTFVCKGCGRPKAQTVKYRVMVDKNCKICRKAYIDSRQTSLFEIAQKINDGAITLQRENVDALMNLPTETSYTP